MKIQNMFDNSIDIFDEAGELKTTEYRLKIKGISDSFTYGAVIPKEKFIWHQRVPQAQRLKINPQELHDPLNFYGKFITDTRVRKCFGSYKATIEIEQEIPHPCSFTDREGSIYISTGSHTLELEKVLPVRGHKKFRKRFTPSKPLILVKIGELFYENV